MQNSKRSRMVPFSVWWGNWKGGFGGVWSLRGVHPKKYTCLPKKKLLLKCIFSSNQFFSFSYYLSWVFLQLAHHSFCPSNDVGCNTRCLAVHDAPVDASAAIRVLQLGHHDHPTSCHLAL